MSSASYLVQERFVDVALPVRVIGRTKNLRSDIFVGQSGGAVSLTLHVTVSLGALISDDADRDREMRTQWLQTDAFPSALFTATGTFASNDIVSGTLPGHLTIRDITHPVTATISARREPDGAFSGEGHIQVLMSTFGISPPSIAGLLSVEDEVNIRVRFVARDAEAPAQVRIAATATPNPLLALPVAYRTRMALYAEVTRPDAVRRIYISRAAVQALRSGQSLPGGTEIVMETYRGGQLDPLVLLRRRGRNATFAGTDLPAALINGDWQYFEIDTNTPARSSADGQTCHACHSGAIKSDYLFSMDALLRFAMQGSTQTFACNRLARRPCGHE
jgi:hypothetical protein